MRRSALLLVVVLSTLMPLTAARGDVVIGPGGGTPGTSSNFELVGHDPLFDLGMNAALAVFEDFVYVGNRTDGSSTCGLGDPRRDVDPNSCPHPHPGILVVDASDPSDPQVVNEIGPPFAGNINETTRELRVWPSQELLIVESFQCSSVIHSCPGTPPVTPSFRFFDLSDPANPTFLSQWVPRQANNVVRTPHEFYLWEDPDDSDRGLLWISTPTGNRNPVNANLLIADISAVPGGGAPVLVAQGNWNDQYPVMPNVALHSMTPTPDGTETHLAYLSGFFLILDTTDVAEGNYEPGEVLDLNDDLLTPSRTGRRGTTPTPDTPRCRSRAGRSPSIPTRSTGPSPTRRSVAPWGWARAIQVGQPRIPRVIGEYKLPENSCPAPSQADQERGSYTSHNRTLTRNLALVTWHSGGFQVIDIEDPGQMTQAGWFSPTPLEAVANEDPALSMGTNKVVMWSFAIVKDGLIYVIDLRNGLYILRYTGRGRGRSPACRSWRETPTWATPCVWTSRQAHRGDPGYSGSSTANATVSSRLMA